MTIPNNVIDLTARRALQLVAREVAEETIGDHLREVRGFYAERKTGESDAQFSRRVVAASFELTDAERLYLIELLDEVSR